MTDNDKIVVNDAELEKELLQSEGEYANDDNEDSDNEDSNESVTSRYVWAFLIPLIGFIEGAILLASEQESQRSSGSGCIIASLISVVIYYLIIFKR